MQIQNERRPLDHLKSFAAWCHLIYLMKNYLTERFLYDLEMKTREQNRNNKPTERERLACFKRSDSGERCEVKKAMKSRGGLSPSLAFIFSRSFLLRTAPHYLNAWNRLESDLIGLSNGYKRVWLLIG